MSAMLKIQTFPSAENENKYLRSEMKAIYEALFSLETLSRYDSIQLQDCQSLITMIMQRMSSAFSSIDTNLLSEDLNLLLKGLSSDEEKQHLLNLYYQEQEKTPYCHH